ncbi:MAG TPA: TIGR00153 family protein [Acidobacteria bacterium]|nr:TIGR00153 family protein [Acidobacteriota bacterium]
MVRALVGLFAKNPFKPLQAHMEMVMGCVRLVPDLMEAVVAGDEIEVKRVRKEITRTEHEADLVKNELRDNLPRTLFMPVSRADLLELLHHQDDIADGAEDAAILADIKPLTLPDDLGPRVVEFAQLCVTAAESAEDVVGRLDDLLETGFTGPEADEVMKMIAQVGQQEWEADKAAFKLLKEILRDGSTANCVDVIVWMKLCEALGNIANAAEQVANYLRLMLAR